MPQVSIITPCYNSQEFVGRTIESVRAQMFADWEHLVVDDGSTDGSAAVVEAYTDDPRLRLIRQPNGGVCNARNNGFKATSPDSKYLLFLDADDCLLPEMLTVLTKYLDAHPETGLVHSDVIYINVQDNILPAPPMMRCVPSRWGVSKLSANQPVTPLSAILCGAPVWPSFSVLRRSVYEGTPGWDEQLGQHHEDVDLFTHFSLLSQLHYVPQPLCFYRRHEGQSSSLPERHRKQSQKFDAKWQSASVVPTEYKPQLRAALQFRNRRLAPLLRFQVAKDCLQKGSIAQAVRHGLWAALRYVGVLA